MLIAPGYLRRILQGAFGGLGKLVGLEFHGRPFAWLTSGEDANPPPVTAPVRLGCYNDGDEIIRKA